MHIVHMMISIRSSTKIADVDQVRCVFVVAPIRGCSRKLGFNNMAKKLITRLMCGMCKWTECMKQLMELALDRLGLLHMLMQ